MKLATQSSRGFTLAELLISLAILGVIATFTIPKIIASQQASKYNAMSKEVAGMITGAFQKYRYEQGEIVGGVTTDSVLLPYMNYVTLDTSSM